MADIYTLMALLTTAIFGLVMGSFCNNWAYRLCRGQSVAKGRSHCPDCGHTLAAKDLIPLLSWALLRGRCRYCGGKISIRYPLAEILSALVFLSLLSRFSPSGQWLELARWALLAPLLLTLALADWESWELPDGLILACAIWFVPCALLQGGGAALLDGLVGAVAVAGPLLIVVLAADKLVGQETMGGGDIKLIAMLGLHLGAGRVLLLFILACFIGIIMALLPFSPSEKQEGGSGKAGLHSIPFGPSLLLATWATVLWGEGLIHWYLSLFH